MKNDGIAEIKSEKHGMTQMELKFDLLIKRNVECVEMIVAELLKWQ